MRKRERDETKRGNMRKRIEEERERERNETKKKGEEL